ncbi:hypothetical protein GCK32_021975, partial [Trichostrongylus colubriformis]
VYGYFRRDFDEEKQLDVSPKLIQTPIDKIGITKDTLILVDITGIVNSKAKKGSLLPPPTPATSAAKK